MQRFLRLQSGGSEYGPFLGGERRKVFAPFLHPFNLKWEVGVAQVDVILYVRADIDGTTTITTNMRQSCKITTARGVWK